jgi:hypothetical protein
MLELLLPLLILRASRIGLAAGPFLPHVDVEPVDTNVLVREPISQRWKMIQQ